jgi:hypothetical protein
LLNSAQVEYLLLGGYAVAYYGVPRATGDMDVWINPDAANTARLVVALRQFGFTDATITPERFTKPGQVFRMGVPPLRIELLTSVTGLDFPAAYSRRRLVRIDDVGVTLIALEDLQANKRAVGRRKDLDDVDNLP